MQTLRATGPFRACKPATRQVVRHFRVAAPARQAPRRSSVAVFAIKQWWVNLLGHRPESRSTSYPRTIER